MSRTNPNIEGLTDVVVNEGSSGEITGIIRDQNGDPIPLSEITSLDVTLYNKATGAIINATDNLSILNENGGTVAAFSGLMTWAFTGSDTPIVDTSLPANEEETHGVLFRGTHNDGTNDYVFSAYLEMRVVNLKMVP